MLRLAMDKWDKVKVLSKMHVLQGQILRVARELLVQYRCIDGPLPRKRGLHLPPLYCSMSCPLFPSFIFWKHTHLKVT